MPLEEEVPSLVDSAFLTPNIFLLSFLLGVMKQKEHTDSYLYKIKIILWTGGGTAP